MIPQISSTPSNTPSNTATITPTSTSCPLFITPTHTQTNTPTIAVTQTMTPTMTFTPTRTATPTMTPTPSAISYLLDVYGSAKVAYSLRRLRASQTNAITIRRSNDNATQDIGFVGQDLDTAAITSFVGSNDAFITKWWDQSGNGNDLTRVTNSEQPRIVSGGTIQLARNSKPAIFFDGSNDYFTLNTGITTVNTLTEAWVIDRTSGSTFSIGLASSSALNPFYSFWFSDNSIYFRPGSVAGVFLGAGSTANDYLLFSVFSGNSWSISRNNFPLGSQSYTGSGLSLNAFGRRSSNYNQSLQQEYVLWESSQASNQTGIQNNINNYYSVY